MSLATNENLDAILAGLSVLVSVLGICVVIWSLLRTRKQFYNEFKNRNRHDS